MALSARIKERLYQLLGDETAEALVRSIEESDSLRGDVAELRHQMELGFVRVDARFANLEKLISDRAADLIKWSFAFWVGAVLAIAALARVLGQ